MPTLKSKAQSGEKGLQKRCERYLRTNKITYFRIPDCVYTALFSKTSKINPLARRIASEMFKGFADLVIFFPESGRYIMVELKNPNGKGKLSKEQLIQQSIHGDNYYVLDDYNDFVELLEN